MGLISGFVGLAEDVVGFALDLVEDVTKSDAQSHERHDHESNVWELYHKLRRDHEELKSVQRATYASVKRRGDTIIELSKKLGCMKTESDDLKAELEKSVAQLLTVAALRNGGVEAIGVGIELERTKKELARQERLKTAAEGRELVAWEQRDEARAATVQAVNLMTETEKERDACEITTSNLRADRDACAKERDDAREETKQQARKFDEWAQQKSEELAATRVTLMAARSDTGLWKEKHDAAIEDRDLAVKKYDLYREHIRKAGDQINPLLQKGHERIAELQEDVASLTHATNTLADFIYYVVIEEAIAEDAFRNAYPPNVTARACPHQCEGCNRGAGCADSKDVKRPRCCTCGKTLAP